MIAVVSTAFAAPTERICRESVAAQRLYSSGVLHEYVDASKQATPKPASQNLFEAVEALQLNPSDICVWLDGDDWLPHDQVLAFVEAVHDQGAWLTYGQYVTSDGHPGHCGQYASTDYRKEPWLASHLRTFRAGLFQKLTPEDLQVDGKWLERGVDVAVMLPLLELAGPDRIQFCPDVLCVYNTASAWETTAVAAALAEEERIVQAIRQKPRKEALQCL